MAEVDANADQLARALRAAIGPLHRRMRSLRDTQDLGDTAAEVLTFLNDHGPQSLSDLSAAFHVKPGSMSQAVKRLTGSELVTRHADPDDGRRVLLAVTAAGAEYVRLSRTQRQAWLTERVAALSPADRDLLSRAAEIIRALTQD